MVMNAIVKWIGGFTALVALFLGSAAITGYVLEARASEGEGDAPRIEAERVLATDEAADLAKDDIAQADNAASQVETSATPQVATPAPAPAPAAAQPFVVKRILPIEGPIRYGEWHWDDEGVPDGPLVMTVDLDARTISIFRGGYEIGAAAALLGTPEHPTPTGIFPILTKERHNVSEKYDNAPMPWTLRLTWDGVAIHGGSNVQNGYASHGCIAIPDGLAAKLFAVAKKGDRVIITRGKRLGAGDTIIDS
jgi:lipoprotein-anchoring transpeptidase ErfK/SrfK